MIRSRNRMWICASLMVLNVAFIWVNSLLPSQMSSAFSRFVGSILNFILPGPDIPPTGGGHGTLRKIAHITEFACLGVLLSWCFRMMRQKKWEFILWPVAVGMLVGAIDETIQCFVPGRGPRVFDVCIDTAGVLLGVLVFAAILRRRKQKK